MITRQLITKAGHKIIYDFVEGSKIPIIFLSGLMSDRKGSKASFFAEYAANYGHSYVAFDYLGHGESDLDFTECNIDIWLENVLEMLELFVGQKIILIGSSLGGWLAILAALKKPGKIESLITLAAAPDFTEDLMWQNFSPEIQAQLAAGQIYNLPSDYCDGEYPITMQLIESGRNNLLLKQQHIPLTVPIKMFHGALDEDVPVKYAELLKDKLPADLADLNIIPDGDHRLSRTQDLAMFAEYLLRII